MSNIFRIVAALIIVLTLLSCGNNDTERKQKSAQQKPKVEVVSVSYGKIESEITFPAELRAIKEIDLFAKVSGYVKSLKVNIGSKVKKGDLLILLEAPELNAQLSAAQSRLKSQQSRFIAAEKLYKRLLEARKVEGTISANDLEQAEAEKNAQYAQLEAVKASYREAMDMRQYLEIRAPYSGTITSRDVNIGSFVGSGTSSPLMTLQQVNVLKFTFSAPEIYSGHFKVGDEVSFRVNSFPNEQFVSKISRLSGALDTRLRSEQIEIDYDNRNQRLLPGMVGEVILPLRSREKTFVIPNTAVLTNTEGNFLLLVENGKINRKPVKIGMEAEGKIEVFNDDIAPDDKIILRASDSYSNGETFK